MTQTKAATIIDKLVSVITLATIFLTPIYFNPFTSNIFDLNKTLLIATSSLILLVLWMVRNMITKSFKLTITPFTGAVTLWVLVIFASSLTTNLPKFVESFVNTTGLITFLGLFFIVASSLKQAQNFANKVLYTIIASGVTLSILSVLESTQFGPGRLIANLNGVEYSPDLFISPTGSVVGLISYLLPVLILCFVLALTKKDAKVKISMFVSAAAVTAALVVSAFMILPGKPNAPIFLPFDTSWIVAVENIKSPKKFLIGTGADDYLVAFGQNRGVEFNQNEFWNVRFNSAHNYPLFLFTTSGLIGLLSWMFVFLVVARTAKKAKSLSLAGKLLILLFSVVTLTILIIPQNIVLMSLIFFTLTALAVDLKQSKNKLVSDLYLKVFAAKLVGSDEDNNAQQLESLKTEVLPLIVGIPSILIALFCFYGGFRVVAADYYFQRSLVMAAQNNGGGAYDNQRFAINNNPYNSNYHRVYSSTNLALANALSNQQDMDETERQNTVSTLVSQAVRSGQNAIRINPSNATNWENLAVIYRSLIGAADDAQEWAVSSYAEAINLDRTNPRLWLDAGGLFYQVENYPQAIELFTRSVQLKPDWANAHYNLANALAQNQELERAINQYEIVLQLVDTSSADYTRALEEQNALRTELGLEARSADEPVSELNVPTPLPGPITDEVELTPEDAPPTSGRGFSDLTDSAVETPQASESATTTEASN